MRYLGVALGYGVALGICAVCGTLIPPLLCGTFMSIASSASGRTTLSAIGIAVIGIAAAALAGLSKVRELPSETKQAAVKEFSFRKGILVALFCGVMSACTALALDAAALIATLSAATGTHAVWTGLPKLVVVPSGGFTTNALWRLWLDYRNHTLVEYGAAAILSGERVPRPANFGLCALAGITWFSQFFIYTMGVTQMGRYCFSSWTLHMASIVVFSTLWGVALAETRGASRRTHQLIALGLAILVLSTLVVGYGNYLALHPAGAAARVEPGASRHPAAAR